MNRSMLGQKEGLIPCYKTLYFDPCSPSVLIEGEDEDIKFLGDPKLRRTNYV